MIAVAVFVMSIINVNYIIIIFCIIKIRANFKQNEATMSKETLRLQHQLNWTFGMQAILPLFVSFGPLAYLGYTVVVEGTAFWSMIWFTTGFSWVPFANAGMTLCIVSEFRHKLIRRHNAVTSHTAPSNQESLAALA